MQSRTVPPLCPHRAANECENPKTATELVCKLLGGEEAGSEARERLFRGRPGQRNVDPTSAPFWVDESFVSPLLTLADVDSSHQHFSTI